MSLPFNESPISFSCAEETLTGILHPGTQSNSPIGVLIVVGGPQYRIGSHRQFLSIARALANAGIPCFRFDYRGMGDASGSQHDFEEVEADIQSAIGAFLTAMPSVNNVVIWALCDGASAGMMYSPKDARIGGMILLNPWVHTEQGEAKALVSHYYGARLLDKAFWNKLISGRFDIIGSGKSFVANLLKSLTQPNKEQSTDGQASLPDRMAGAFQRFSRPTLIILSEDDLTACEFSDLIHSDATWKELSQRPSVKIEKLAQANHTFSRSVWRDQVIEWTLSWLKKL